MPHADIDNARKRYFQEELQAQWRAAMHQIGVDPGRVEAQLTLAHVEKIMCVWVVCPQPPPPPARLRPPSAHRLRHARTHTCFPTS